jgi:hypothetical protein
MGGLLRGGHRRHDAAGGGGGRGLLARHEAIVLQQVFAHKTRDLPGP